MEDVWAVLADPHRLPDWWPGLERVDPTVRHALAPGALWHLEGANRPRILRPRDIAGSLLVLEVTPLRRVAFQLTAERAQVELDLEPAEAGTEAVLALDAPRFGALRRTVPSEALSRLAALVRQPAE